MAMKFRFHRGGLREALLTTVEVNSLAELRAVIEKAEDLITPTGDEPLTVEPYCYDHRIDWDTYIVMWNGFPIGFTNGPL
jgi:hypothetical protein